MISNNILLEVIHKDKFNRGKYKTPKISILDTIKEKKPLIHRFSKRTSMHSISPIKTVFEESEINKSSEFGYSREIKGIILQSKNKFVPLPKLLENEKHERKLSNLDTYIYSIANHTDFSNHNFWNQKSNEKIKNEKYNEVSGSYFAINRNQKFSAISSTNTEFNSYDEKFDTKLKSATEFLPKQKNYEFYRKETNAFKNLKELNKQRRSTLDMKKTENHPIQKNSEEYLTYYSKNFGIKKLLTLKKNLEKENKNMLKDSKEKDENFVKDHFKISQKSLKIKNLGYIHKRQKIESIPNKVSNIGQKFIDFFERKKTMKNNNFGEDNITKENENNKDNYSHVSSKYRFETNTSEDNDYLNVKENNFSEIFNIKNEESTRNLCFLKNENSSENNMNIIDDYKDKAYFYSSTNFYNLKNIDSNFLLKKDPKHFVKKVKERLEKIYKN